MAKVKAAREHILEALRKATFATAGFGSSVDEQRGHDIDGICKRETRLFRESWLIPELIRALIALDPCPACEGRGRMNSSEVCEACNGSRIAGGLPFDPYQLSREAAEGLADMARQLEIADIDLRKNVKRIAEVGA